MKKNFVIDWILVFVAVFSIISGFALHLLGEEGVNDFWHYVALFHILTNLVFLIAVILHVKAHWRWYKGLLKNGIHKKIKSSLILPFVFFPLAISGIVVFALEESGRGFGLWHYGFGIAMTILFVWHLLSHLSILRKSLEAKSVHQDSIDKYSI